MYNNKRRSKTAKIKHEKIIDEWFLNGFNGAKAYKKYNPHIKKNTTLTANFSRIQTFPDIQEYIKLKYDEASKVIAITKEGILKELRNWLEADFTQTFGLTKEQIKELPIELRRMITKYKVNVSNQYNKEGELTSSNETIELHFVSKEKTIDMINKHIGFYEADNEQKAIQINYNELSEKTLLEIWDARKQD